MQSRRAVLQRMYGAERRTHPKEKGYLNQSSSSLCILVLLVLHFNIREDSKSQMQNKTGYVTHA